MAWFCLSRLVRPHAMDGGTAFAVAAADGHVDTCALILAAAGPAAASLTGACDARGLLPLHVAALRGRAKMAETLLVHGAAVDAATRLCGATQRAAEDGWGLTALHYAACSGQTEVVATLLRHGGSPSAGSSLGKQPLHFAAEYGHATAIALLLEKGGSDRDATDSCGGTPLAYAVLRHHEPAVRALLDAGCDASSADSCGCSPITWALEFPLLGDHCGMAHCSAAPAGRGGGRAAVRGARRGCGRGRGGSPADAALAVCQALQQWPSPPKALGAGSWGAAGVPHTREAWSGILEAVVTHPALSAAWSGNSDVLGPIAAAAGAAWDTPVLCTVRDARAALDARIAALFRSVNVGAVFEVAAAERAASGEGDAGAYGEVVPHAFLRLLNRCYRSHSPQRATAKDSGATHTASANPGNDRPAPEDWGTFVDVGSGSGIGVFAAFLALPFRTCAGIELLWEMHRVAELGAQRWKKAAAKAATASGVTDGDGEASAVAECVLEKVDADRIVLRSTDAHFGLQALGTAAAAAGGASTTRVCELLCADAFEKGGRSEALLLDASVVFCNCISWPAELKCTLAAAVTKVGALLLMTAPLPVIPCSVGVPARGGGGHTEPEVAVWEAHTTYCAQSFTPRGRIYLYIRRRPDSSDIL